MDYEVNRTCLTIFLPCELDHHAAEDIRKEADRIMMRENIRQVVFDFERTSFMDSSGVGVIMGRYRSLSMIGGSVTAIHVSERINRILTLSGLGRIMKIITDTPEAQENRQGGSTWTTQTK